MKIVQNVLGVNVYKNKKILVFKMILYILYIGYIIKRTNVVSIMVMHWSPKPEKGVQFLHDLNFIFYLISIKPEDILEIQNKKEQIKFKIKSLEETCGKVEDEYYTFLLKFTPREKGK